MQCRMPQPVSIADLGAGCTGTGRDQLLLVSVQETSQSIIKTPTAEKGQHSMAGAELAYKQLGLLLLQLCSSLAVLLG